MSESKTFVDTNVLVYLFSEDTQKADLAENIVRSGAVASVQVLNELANVFRRKIKMSWPEVNEILDLIKWLCTIEPLTTQVHDQGIALAARYKVSVYDGMIVASALIAECNILFSEDMQHGFVINGTLRIIDPFKDR